jgi:mRNA interferase MazF
LIKIEPSTLNGLRKQSCADTFQVRSVAQQRFVKKLGELSENEMEAITKGLAVVLVI